MKKFYLLLLYVLIGTTAYSQVEVENLSDYPSFDAYRADVFRMNMQEISSGLLLEYSLFPFEPSKLDGLSNDDEILQEKGRVFELLELLSASKVNNNVTIASADSLFAEVYLHRYNTGNVPLTFIYQTYHRIRQSAHNENLLRIAADEIGIEDVPGRTASPYNQHQLFAFAPFADTITQFNNISFSLPQVLWQMPGISNVQVNFDVGRGFRTLSPGSTVSIYYAAEGLKTITARISAGGTTRTAKAQFYYRRPPNFCSA